MSKVIKGSILAVGILFTAGALAFAAPALFAYTATWTIATSIATGAFLSGISAQLASRKGQRPSATIEYSGTVEPRRILYGFNRVSGMHALPPITYGTNNKFLPKVLVLAGHEINAIPAVYFDQVAVGTIGAITGATTDGLVSTGTFANKAWVRRYLGTAGQTADYILDAGLTEWTSDHRGIGVAYVATHKEYDEEVWKTGDTQDTFDTEGKLCYDPRLDTSPGANPTSALYKVYTRNPPLQIADYLTDDTLGLGESPSRIDWDMVVAAADICDELVDVPTATTQDRYHGDLQLFTTTPYEDNIKDLAAGCLGSVLYSGGKWRIRAGAWETPSFEITDSNVMGAMELETAFPYKERWNGIRGSFIDPDNAYQPNEFPPVQSAAYVAADGDSVFKDVAFDCINVYECQRKAIHITRKSRNREVATIPCDMSLWKVRPGDTGIATITELGWDNQQIRCEGWGFTADGGVALRVRAENSADWDDPLETDYLTPLAISTPTPVAFTPDAPSGLAGTAAANYGIQFTWTAPTLMPSAAQYELYEYTASTPFASATKVWSGKSTSCLIQKADQTTRYYWVRVRMPDGTAGATEPASVGVAAAGGGPAEDQFVARGNCVKGFSTLQKVGGTDAWDSDVYSQRGYSSCHVQFKANSTSNYFMVGLNSDPLTNLSYSSIDFAFYCEAGTIVIYESGFLIGSYGDYTTSTVLGITYDGSTITYLVDGQSVRTTTTSGALHMDSSFYTVGAGLNSLQWGPTTNFNIVDTSQLESDSATTVVVATADNLETLGASLSSGVNVATFALTAFGDLASQYSYVVSVDAILDTDCTPLAATYGGLIDINTSDASSIASGTSVVVDTSSIGTQEGVYRVTRKKRFSGIVSTDSIYVNATTWAGGATGSGATSKLNAALILLEVIKR